MRPSGPNPMLSGLHLNLVRAQLAPAEPENMEERGMRLARLSVVAVVVLTILMGGLFVGCGGGGAELKQSNTTMGQQLIDLQSAYDRGIITEREYEKAKKEILSQYK